MIIAGENNIHNPYNIYSLDRILFKYFTLQDSIALFPKKIRSGKSKYDGVTIIYKAADHQIPIGNFIQHYEQIVKDLLRIQDGGLFLRPTPRQIL